MPYYLSSSTAPVTMQSRALACATWAKSSSRQEETGEADDDDEATSSSADGPQPVGGWCCHHGAQIKEGGGECSRILLL